MKLPLYFRPDGTHRIAQCRGARVTVNGVSGARRGRLGVPAERIVCRSGDPFGPVLTNPAIGSRTAMLVGSAFKTAADTVIEKGKNLAAEMLEAPADDIEFVKGRLQDRRN